MRIGMIWRGKVPPPNVRIEKEARSLVEAGHEVHLLAEGRRGEPTDERVGAVHLHRGIRMGMLREIAHRYTFSFTYRDPAWRRAIDRFVRERSIEALQAIDLPMLRETLDAGSRFGIPVVADLHENWPAGLQVWYSNLLKRATIYNFDRWAAYERHSVGAADAVIVVIEEAKERVARLGVPPERIRIVPNTPRRESAAIPVDGEILKRYEGLFPVVYVGGFAPHRGLDTVVRAAPLLAEVIPNLRLVLVGDRNLGYRRSIERLIRDLGAEKLVELAGWQPFEKTWSFIRAAAVCLVPHARNPHTDTTIPNKIFDYMMMSKPYIVSDCPPLARIARESRSGLVFRAGDAAELAGRIRELHGSAELRRSLAEAGRRAYEERYTWERTSGPLIELYEILSGRKRGEGR